MRAQITLKSEVVGGDVLMSLDGAAPVTLDRRKHAFLGDKNKSVIGWAEECCNQEGSSCQDVSGGACVTE